MQFNSHFADEKAETLGVKVVSVIADSESEARQFDSKICSFNFA